MTHAGCLQSLQHAIHTTLTADETLSLLIGNSVYDRIPEGTTHTSALLSFGDGEASRVYLSANQHAEKATLNLQMLTRSGSRKLILDALERIQILLDNASLSLTGAFQLRSLRTERISISHAADGISHRGTLRVVAWIELID
jgi:hexokinase